MGACCRYGLLWCFHCFAPQPTFSIKALGGTQWRAIGGKAQKARATATPKAQITQLVSFVSVVVAFF
jgi:hypothetical protein